LSQFTCIPATSTLMPFCSGLVPYLIANETNQTQQDTSAQQGALPNLNSCPFYANREYQCRKHFPECVRKADNTTLLIKICVDSCYQGQTYSNRLCGHFSPLYFQRECGDLDFYTDSAPPHCYAVQIPQDSATAIWKIALVSILGLIAVGLLCSYLRSRYKQYRTRLLLETEDEIDERRNAQPNLPVEVGVEVDGEEEPEPPANNLSNIQYQPVQTSGPN